MQGQSTEAGRTRKCVDLIKINDRIDNCRFKFKFTNNLFAGIIAFSNPKALSWLQH